MSPRQSEREKESGFEFQRISDRERERGSFLISVLCNRICDREGKFQRGKEQDERESRDRERGFVCAWSGKMHSLKMNNNSDGNSTYTGQQKC